MQGASHPRLTSPQRHALGLILIIGCAALAVHVLWLPQILVDDAFISFRYARNLADGHGLTFNPPERVEGYSNALWVLITALGMRCNLDPIPWTRSLGAAALMGTLITAVLLTRRLTGTRWAAPVVAILIAASTALCGASMAGLETGLYMFLLTAAIATAATDRPWIASILMGLAALTRPEGAALCLIAIALAALFRNHGSTPRRISALTLPCGLLVAASILFRLWYFGDWLPNSVRAKSAMLPLLASADPADWPSLIFNQPGLAYVTNFLRYAFGPVVLFAIVPLFRARTHRFAAALMLATVAMAGAVAIYNFGDWMSSFRLLAPYLPILSILVIWGMAETICWSREKQWQALSAISPLLVAGLILYCALGQFQWRRPSVLANPDAEIAAALNASHQPNLLAATDVLGRLGFYAPHIPILDMAGLTDRTIATHGQPRPPFGRSDFDYVLEQRPHLIMNNVRSAWTRRLARPDFVKNYWWLDNPSWTHPDPQTARQRTVFVRRGTQLETELRARYPQAHLRPPTDLTTHE
ncbi:MAG: hypothetical protein ACE5EC_04295 [Phycisphaerae bacterium]